VSVFWLWETWGTVTCDRGSARNTTQDWVVANRALLALKNDQTSHPASPKGWLVSKLPLSWVTQPPPHLMCHIVFQGPQTLNQLQWKIEKGEARKLCVFTRCSVYHEPFSFFFVWTMNADACWGSRISVDAPVPRWWKKSLCEFAGQCNINLRGYAFLFLAPDTTTTAKTVYEVVSRKRGTFYVSCFGM
jgi:hypothetical protein